MEDSIVEVLTDISGDCDAARAFAAFEKHYGIPAAEMNFKKYLGIILIDGLQWAEEKNYE